MATTTSKPLAQAGYAPASIGDLYQVPALTRALIDGAVASNPTATARTLKVQLVPSGETPGDEHLVIPPVSILPGETRILSELLAQTLLTGDKIRAEASAASAIVVRISGREVV